MGLPLFMRLNVESYQLGKFWQSGVILYWGKCFGCRIALGQGVACLSANSAGAEDASTKQNPANRLSDTLAQLKGNNKMQTMAQVAKFFEHNPTQLGSLGKYKFWEHPTRGDTAPIYMSTPDGRLINTGFYDIEDFDIQLCIELDKGIC